MSIKWLNIRCFVFLLVKGNYPKPPPPPPFFVCLLIYGKHLVRNESLNWSQVVMDHLNNVFNQWRTLPLKLYGKRLSLATSLDTIKFHWNIHPFKVSLMLWRVFLMKTIKLHILLYCLEHQCRKLEIVHFYISSINTKLHFTL